MHSLRIRLLLATVLVAAVAVLASALLSRRVVTSEFRRFVTSAQPVPYEVVTRALDRIVSASGSLAGADTVLARCAPQIGHDLLLADERGDVFAASAPMLRTARITESDSGAIIIEGRSEDRLRLTGLALELRNPPRRVIRSRDGRSLGTLYALPGVRGAGVARGANGDGRDGMVGPAGDETAVGTSTESQPAFLQSVDRGLWLGALVAIVLGALLVWLLSGRIVGPIEALTAAARRLERGDLTARVEVGGRDEVAALGRSFNAMAESLSRSQSVRRQMTHDVAHELRTPLTNLRAQIEAIQDGLVPAGAESLASLHEEVLLLSRLVEDLAQLAEAESGALRLELADVPVRDAFESAATAFAARAAEGGVAIEVNADPRLVVRADASRLGQILRNLLANALTHTPRGGRVVLEARSGGSVPGERAEGRAGEARGTGHASEEPVAAAGSVELEVRDSGAGIAPEHLPHVFERFYRADPSRSRATGGAGLGLAIVRHLAEAQGGRVRVESEPGRGTRFLLTLPVP